MNIEWEAIDKSAAHVIPARPAGGLWTMVRTHLVAPATIRVEASGTWRVAPDLPECGPDGLRHWAYGREGLLTRKAPLGALIGKYGGSSASADEADIFVVGSAAVLTLDKPAGPLYLTINGVPAMFGGHQGALDVLLA